MNACVGLIPGCEDCLAELGRGEHECDDLCRFDGERKRDSDEYHRLIHAPQLCHRCNGLLDDRRGNDRMVQAVCSNGTCRLLACPDCSEVWGSSGPVGCPECSPDGWVGSLVAWVGGLWGRWNGSRRASGGEHR